MSTTRRSKKDIDRFISQFPEDQISARGYQVAVLYCEIGEYDLAKKYLSSYMSVRDTMPQAHKLMAQICEGLQEKEQAIACYKRCLELDNSQKGTILKICEVLSSMPPDDAQRIKYWSEKAEKVFPNNPVVFKLKEKILSSSSGTDLDKLEELYSKQLEKNYTDASLHIKLMELYLTSDRVQAAVNHGIEVERTLAFVQHPAWYKCLIKAFSVHHQREQGSDDIYIHHLFALQNLVFQMMPDHDVVTCATALHQFDQCLFELARASSQRPKWRAVVTEMEGQIYFLSALVLFKRAQKGQVLWKDASFFATVCLLLSSQYPAIDVKAAWYQQLKQHNRKFFDRMHKIGAYRQSQGGYLVLAMTRSDSVARLQHIKQQLRTPRAREVFYDTLFTLREMRDRKDKSYILNSDTFHKVPVVVPSKAVVTQYDKDVLLLYGDNLHILVWQALQSYSTRDTTQPYYGMNLYAKLPYTSTALTNGSPESLSQVDVQAFFCATVRCAAMAYEDQNKSFRPDSYRPHFLPACLSQSLCSKVQGDWWEAMFKFSVGTARDNYAKLRLTIQQGLETIRLVGAHGMGLTLVTHLAQTFDKWAQTLKQDELSDCTKSDALEGRAVFYWKEAMMMLKRLEKNLPYRYPKERMFVDGNQGNLEAGQIADLKEQATFSLAVLDMREGRYEEAKDKFETSKKPMASYHLAQIFRILANKVSSDSPGGSEQKRALLERSLDMLYQALDRIQGDTEHELHKEIPNTLDEVVSLLERMQMPTGTSLIDSISINNNADTSNDETPSFSTPTSFHTTPGAGQNGTPINRNANVSGSWGGGSIEPLSLFPKESPTFVPSNIIEQSTPAPPQRRESSQHVRPSPERLDARIWALEKKMATLIELQEQSKKHWERTVQDAIKTMQEEMRAEMAQKNDILKEMKEFLASFRGSAAGRFIGPAPFRPPQYYPPQQQSWMPPGNYGYPMSPVPGAPLAPYPGNMGPYPPANRLTPQPPVGSTINQMSHQNDIVEDDIYHIDGEYYEDDGSQPPPHNMYNEAQLSQEWPFGHRAGLEGKSTITYTPPGQQSQPMQQPGMFASSLRGQSLQYTIKQTAGMAHMPGPRLPTSQPPTQPLPGPGFFSFPQASAAMFNPQDPTYQMAGRAGIVLPPASQPSALMAVLTRSPSSDVSTTPVSTIPANVLTTSCMQAQSNMGQADKDSLFEGKPVSICQPQSMASLGQTSSPGSVPLFTSLMAASKSPDTSDVHQSSLRSAEVPSGTGSKTDSLNLTPFTDFASLAKSSPQPGMFRPTSTVVQKSPMTSPGKSLGRHDDDVVEEYEPKVDFKPIIDLPDLVEVKTGEEEEEKVFGERAKLFRYDPDTNQWKERGIGEMKLLRHRTTKQVRVLMRREQVLKLCANHMLTTAMKLVPMANSDRAWCWTAMDYAEGELKTERLAVRFKNPDQAHLFKQAFEECQEEIQKQEQKPPVLAVTKEKPAKGQTSLAEMFKPAAGSWECDACYVSNKGDVQKCVACNTRRPGAKPASAATTKTKATPKPVATGQTLRELFQREEGSWDCDGCYVNNKAEVQKCVACQALKPGLKAPDVKPSPASSAGLSGFKFGASPVGGFKFGTPSAESVAETKTTPSVSKPAAVIKAGQQSLSEMFKPAVGSWECNGCYVSNKPEAQKCVACNALKPGLKPQDVKPTATSSVGPTGFTFGAPAAESKAGQQSLSEMFKPAVGSWECNGCYVSNKPEAQKCVACNALKPGLKPQDVKPAETSSVGPTGFTFGAPATGGFKFGIPPAASAQDTKTTPSSASAAPTSAGFTFGQTPAFSFKKTETATSTSSTSTTAEGTGGFKFNMATLASSSSQPTSTTTPSSTTPSSSTGKITPGIGSGIPPAQSTAKPPAFGAPEGGFNFNLSKTSTDPPQQTLADSTTAPATFKFATTADTKSPAGFSFKPTTEPKTPESKQAAVSSGFQFTFNHPGAQGKSPGVTSPKSPEVEDYYQNKEGEDDHIHFEPIVSLPEAVAIVTGEENDEVLYEHRAKLYRFDKQEWKERGLGNVKILCNSDTGKCRLLMRREQILKVCCHHYITPDLMLKPMPKTDGKAFIWFAMDFSDETPNMENFSIRFKSAEVARKFADSFEKAREKSGDEVTEPKGSQADGVVKSPEVTSSPVKSEEVVFVSEEKATEEQIAKARKYMLPDHFYLYLSHKPCSGCRGCTDSMPGDPASKPADSTTTGVSSEGPLRSSEAAKLPSSVLGSGESAGPGLFSGLAPGPVFGASPTPGTPSTGAVFGTKAGSQSTGGIFNTPTTGGLFGSLPSSKAPSTGGLFSSMPATTTPSTGGLFGTMPTTTAPTTGGLFSSMPTTTTPSTGGLFGTMPTTTATTTEGLFGSMPTTTAASTGGLFGTTPTTTAPTTGGLFSSMPTTTAPTTGGLFGTTPTTTAPTTGGLFSSMSTTTAASTGGLFGSMPTTTAPTTGGLFSSMPTTTAPTTGGLFSSMPTTTAPTTGGLFGTTPTTTAPTTGGLFSSMSTTTAASTGGLFGSMPTTTAPTTGGLFSSMPTTTAPTTGGLFSSMPTTTALTTGGLFGSVPPTSLFGTQPTAPASEPGSTPKDSGDHSVSPGGTIFGGQSSNTAGEFSFSQLASQSGSENAFKKDDSKPFSWSGAGKQLFGIKGQDGGTHDGDDDDQVVDGHDPHFEPIVALPDLVEIKTGEEDFDALFSTRAKLFRFDKDVNQWKEKGIGEMKILQQHHTGKIRLLLRREQIYKLACNHWLSTDLMFKPMATSEVAWCWTAQDYSENEPRMEQLAVKFKNIGLAIQFKEMIDKCQTKMREMPQPTQEDKMPIQVSEVTSVEASGAETSQPEEEEEDDEEVEEEEEEDEDDDDDDELILFEKRATLYTKENGTWKALGMGQLKVVYDEDVNGNRIVMETDEKVTVCNHLLTKESVLKINKKQRNCEWCPIDFTTDDPVRREFRAQFSSETVLDEFERFFLQGQTLAVDSDISERDMMMTYPREIVYPEVHAHSAGAED